MTDNIKKIFSQNIELLALVDKAVIYFREQQYDKALGISAQTVTKIKDMTDAVIEDREYFRLVSVESVMEMLEGLLETKKKKDYVLLADLFEMQLSAFICNVQELIINKESFLAFDEDVYHEKIELLSARITESLEADFTDQDMIDRCRVNQNAELERDLEPGELLKEGYRVEFTSGGQMTIGSVDIQGREFYLHSNNKVCMEAFLLAKSWAAKDTDTYVIYGMGMGYHIQELLYVEPDARLEIYESDINILKLFCAFSNLKELLCDDEIKIVYDPDGSRMRKRLLNIRENEKVCVHYPSLCNIKDEDRKEMLMEYIPWAKLIEEC